MNNVFKLIPLNINDQCLMLYPNQSKLIDKTMQTTTIHFGFQEMEVNCKQLNTLKENEIGLSNTTIEKLQLPLGVDYELSIQKDGIIIGPFIGLLIANTDADLKRKLKNLYSIVKQYPLVRGTIVVFSWEGLDQKHYKINGYIYNPTLQK
ncbi:hypothetical protein ACQKP0_11825 [Heyndrickxia sp. NPDC080065]|uniref:hypothetical protein n=1 Tax=Heyndrickxia sp. NPDC080065 TaxID=3390568 RepID=UPI003D04A9F4